MQFYGLRGKIKKTMKEVLKMQYEFEYAFPDAAAGDFAGAASAFIGIFLIVYLLVLGFSLISYVLNAVGMYRIAKRRGIHHAWLAWIPVGANWLLGSISDHYQYVAKQKVTSRRKILLALSIVSLVVSVLFSALCAVLSYAGEDAGVFLGVGMMLFSCFGVIGLSIATAVFAYIAYYDLFQSCRPDYSILFLILGIIFSVTMPFFTFACSGYDRGMPPRRVPQPPVQIPSPQPEIQEEVPVVETEVVDDSE